jgi:signal transduction histidine kinase
VEANRRGLRLLTTWGPALFIAIFEYIRHSSPVDQFLPVWASSLMVLFAMLVGAHIFSSLVFGIIDRMEAEILTRNKELAARNALTQALYQIGTEISAKLDLDHVILTVVVNTRRLLGSDIAALGLVDERSEEIAWRLLKGDTPDLIRLRAPVSPSWSSCFGEEGRTRRFTDPSSEAWRMFPAGEVREILVAPLCAGAKKIGLLMAASRATGRFDQEAETVLTSLANQAAIAIENARLHAQVQSLAVLEERERIAREMHDGLAQVLGYVNTKAQAVRELLKGGRLEEASSQLAQLESMAREVYADVREAILGLRTSLSPERGLLPVLKEYFHHYRQLYGIAVEVESEVDSFPLAPEVEVQLLRIVQEALTNVRKHAQATAVKVRFLRAGRGLRIEIEDNGRGFDPQHLPPSPWPRFGLQSMRERAEAIGGTFHIESTPLRGTRLTVTVPLKVAVEEGSPV